MSNWFAGIGQAASGLEAARYGLSVVSQNMTNADTAGYTREASQQESVQMGNVPSLYTRNPGLGGVQVVGTTRQTDVVLDARVRTEHARGALADTSASQASAVEQVFPEPSDDGFGGQLSQLWSDYGTLSNNPTSTAARTVVLKDASGVASSLNTMSSQLSDLVTSTQSSLSNDVDATNKAADQLATLNGQIAVGTATGQNVNSLLDQRDTLLQQLSSLNGASVTIQANGSATVAVGGQTLVDGVHATAMTVDSSNTVSVGGTAVTIGSGSMAAEITNLTTTLPGYQSRLDAVADQLSSVVNGLQTSGYDQHGNPGTPIFSGSGAANIKVVLTDPAGIAASSTPGGNADGSNALKASQTALSSGSPDALYTSLVGDVAGASAQASSQSNLQDSVVSNVDAMKASISGVSQDEEASNMLVYQQAFNASSRVLTTMDDMLDTLINHTGRVGLA
jgi:flagellar hook-associated protein 1